VIVTATISVTAVVTLVFVVIVFVVIVVTLLPNNDSLGKRCLHEQ
jgi:hypothetical protein